jgi:hypothetical protein
MSSLPLVTTSAAALTVTCCRLMGLHWRLQGTVRAWLPGRWLERVLRGQKVRCSWATLRKRGAMLHSHALMYQKEAMIKIVEPCPN